MPDGNYIPFDPSSQPNLSILHEVFEKPELFLFIDGKGNEITQPKPDNLCSSVLLQQKRRWGMTCASNKPDHDFLKRKYREVVEDNRTIFADAVSTLQVQNLDVVAGYTIKNTVDMIAGFFVQRKGQELFGRTPY